MTQNNGKGLRAQTFDDEPILPLEYAEIEDPDLRASLQRCEDRIISFTQDMTDSLFAMAPEFRLAREKLVTGGRGGLWGRWVARFHGGISVSTATRLAEIGQLERNELDALRSGLFAKTGGIAGIAAYLSAPVEIQDKVQKGEVSPVQKEIQSAARAFKEAQEAIKRAEERERAARLAEATVEEKIEAIRHAAQMQGQLAVQEATAKLQREVDEARHQATLRQRDMEEAQKQIQRAQAEWNERLAYAKKEERERLEVEHAKEMRAFQEQLKEQEKAAKKAQQQAAELNERLTHARDSEAIRARWDVLAIDLTDYLDSKLAHFPSVADAQYFEAHERTLADGLVKRLEIVLQRAKELSRPSMTIVDAD